MKYDFTEIEKKWQTKWKDEKTFACQTGDTTKPKFYGLVEFPYPSGNGQMCIRDSVHAEVYVANFRTTSTIPCDRIPLAVNTRLPNDIVVVKATQVPDSFNAIGSCQKKEYTYRLYNSRLGNPFYVDRAWFYPKHLDESVMQRAASQFVGTHDFRAVRSVGTETRTTVRTVHYFQVERKGELIECRVCADGFLYNMVRAMVGTVVYAAEGKLAPEDIPAILDSGNRTLAGPTVPPGGLYMTCLLYTSRCV